MTHRLKTLLLAMLYEHRASYYDDWLDAFRTSPEFACEVVNIRRIDRKRLSSTVDDYDAVVLLHNCTADTVDELVSLAPALADRRSSRVLAFVGNEYNSAFAPLSEKIAALRALRPDVIATQLLEEAGAYLYGDTGARVISLPHALNPAAFRPGPAHERRRIDIGVRSFRYPVSLGDDDRNRIIDFFAKNGPQLHLSIDIDQNTRFDRDDWASFLSDCRGTVSSEAGSWFLDRDDKLARDVHQHLSRFRRGWLEIGRRSAFRKLARGLPAAARDWLAQRLKSGLVRYEGFEPEGIDFKDVADLFFKTANKAPVYSKAISSRHFDAIGTKTCQIMLPGRYNDILRPHEHFILLESELQNVEEAVGKFRDLAERQAVVERAYEHVMSAHTHAHRMVTAAAALRA